ncbi:MAG: ABC-type sugar transport system substrate-binding protein [Phenylobacterium sp.]|jgi:ABC-type sugar transport system substrate-binding protein
MWYRVVQVVFILLFSGPVVALDRVKPLNVVLFSPNFNEQDFWGNVHHFARASATSLGINFSVKYNALGGRAHYLESVESVLKSDDKPDAFMAVSFLKITQRLLALADKYHVPVILINNALPEDTSKLIGAPRTIHENFIGHIAADDYRLSYLLTNYLLERAKMVNKDKVINMVAIAGSRDAPETVLRNKGLDKAVDDSVVARLMQRVYADWRGEEAYRMSHILMKRHDPVQVIWCSSDLMALNAQRAIEQSDRTVFTGGIDWTKEAIESIKAGHLTASAGGHFTDAGYGLVLLYDYFNGRDFAQVMDLSSHSAAAVIHQGNINNYYDLLIKQDWQSIDFKQFSRVYHPQNKGYDFSFEHLFKLAAKK